MSGRHVAGKAGDPAHDWFFEAVATQPKSIRQLAFERAGTGIVLLTLIIVTIFILTGGN